jgi:hypothetical protein
MVEYQPWYISRRLKPCTSSCRYIVVYYLEGFFFGGEIRLQNFMHDCPLALVVRSWRSNSRHQVFSILFVLFYTPKESFHVIVYHFHDLVNRNRLHCRCEPSHMLRNPPYGAIGLECIHQSNIKIISIRVVITLCDDE